MGYPMKKEFVDNWANFSTTMMFVNQTFACDVTGGSNISSTPMAEEGASPGHGGRSICRYIADESTKVGMRAYINWVFHKHYIIFYTRWAWARAIPSLRDKVMEVCFEDLADKSTQSSKVKEVMTFMGLLNNKSPYHRRLPYSGGHATSHDPTIRMQLRDVIREVDADYFNGEIAWLHSILPCQSSSVK